MQPEDSAVIVIKRPLLYKLGVGGLVCALSGGLLTHTVAACMNSRARPGDIALLVIDLLEDLVQFYVYDLEHVALLAICTVALYLPLIWLYAALANAVKDVDNLNRIGKATALSVACYLFSLVAAANSYTAEADEFFLSLLPNTLAVLACVCSSLFYMGLFKQQRAAGLPGVKQLILGMGIVCSGLCGMLFLVAVAEADRYAYMNSYFMLPLLSVLYIAVALSALVYPTDEH